MFEYDKRVLHYIIYQALKTGIIISDARKQYQEFCIPIIVIPVTYSNNVPGTDFSLGADTALNQVVKVTLNRFDKINSVLINQKVFG